MSSHTGTYRLGPDHATLTLRTGTAGAMAKAGHSLEIRVETWSAQLELSEDPAAGALSLSADSRSLKVIDGVGGPKALTDDDRVKIAKTINDKILKGSEITFHSSEVTSSSAGALEVRGDLTLLGATRPIQFALTLAADGSLSATTEVVQTSFGIEPYSAMMGALKVKDELRIEVHGALPPAEG